MTIVRSPSCREVRSSVLARSIRPVAKGRKGTWGGFRLVPLHSDYDSLRGGLDHAATVNGGGASSSMRAGVRMQCTEPSRGRTRVTPTRMG